MTDNTTNIENRYFKDLNRRDYIQKAFEIIKDEGTKGISIRRLAKEMGCSSTCLYRYFKNLDELLFYANMGFLNSYLIDLNRAEKTWKNVWDQHLGVWECYTRAAFKYPEAFDMLFFHENSKKLGTAVKEYYNMFPENISVFNNHLRIMLENPDFYERDYEMCIQCVKAGKISEYNAKRMNHMECTLYMGYLKDILLNGIEECDIENRVKCFVEDVKDIAEMYADDFKYTEKLFGSSEKERL